MNKTRRSRQILACVAAAVLLAGCRGGGAAPAPSDTAAAQSAATSEQSATAPAPSGTAETLTMLLPDRFFALGAGTQDGYYYVQPGTSDSLTGQIRYVDYAAATDAPLSAQGNGDSGGETDPLVSGFHHRGLPPVYL